ncbi:hypothetical protein EBR04_06220, partial [bacterium]|nr:hypothetical protein [bacterium]
MKRQGFLMADGARVPMRGSRRLAIVVHACGIVVVQAALAQAADAWPTPSPEWLSRDAGGGLAILPMILWWA